MRCFAISGSTCPSPHPRPSRLDMVERCYAEATTKTVERGPRTRVRALDRDIGDRIVHWNEDPEPDVSVKTADQMLATLARYCERVSTGHRSYRVRLVGTLRTRRVSNSGTKKVTTTSFLIKALDGSTFPDFAELAARHNGVWGGCWCLEFHAEGAQRGTHRRAAKEARVHDGRAHAALVFDGPRCVGWCQFGSPDELPRIKRRRAHDAAPVQAPDWRITCFFVDKDHRGRAVASAALAGALAEISRLGGGTVESFPEQTDDRRVSAGFLNNATVSLFERHGFTKVRPLGTHHWLMATTIEGSRRHR